MEIRRENTTDFRSIHRLTTDAFESVRVSEGREAVIIDNLRADGDLTLSLVALDDSTLVGHIAFSPVQVGNVTYGWYGLGPISVSPVQQRKGIGSALVKKGLSLLRDGGAEGCALIGDPNYYSRFGFKSDGNLQYQNLPEKLVQWVSFKQQRPEGELVFSPAFNS